LRMPTGEKAVGKGSPRGRVPLGILRGAIDLSAAGRVRAAQRSEVDGWEAGMALSRARSATRDASPAHSCPAFRCVPARLWRISPLCGERGAYRNYEEGIAAMSPLKLPPGSNPCLCGSLDCSYLTCPGAVEGVSPSRGGDARVVTGVRSMVRWLDGAIVGARCRPRRSVQSSLV
jgi:hypothetical protein